MAHWIKPRKGKGSSQGHTESWEELPSPPLHCIQVTDQSHHIKWISVKIWILEESFGRAILDRPMILWCLFQTIPTSPSSSSHWTAQMCLLPQWDTILRFSNTMVWFGPDLQHLHFHWLHIFLHIPLFFVFEQPSVQTSFQTYMNIFAE